MWLHVQGDTKVFAILWHNFFYVLVCDVYIKLPYKVYEASSTLLNDVCFIAIGWEITEK